MEVLFIVISIILFILLGAIIFIKVSSSPISIDEAKIKIENKITAIVNKKSSITAGVVLLDSPTYQINTIFTAGKNQGKPLPQDQPFHVASVGKAFTATLIGCLMEEKKLGLDDIISGILPSETLHGLFQFDNIDYSNKVTIRMLLNHTSGIADYFEDKPHGSDSLQDLILSNPDKFWTPDELIAFTRDYQSPLALPGEKYHYSDSGYILLGLIIEQVSGVSFHSYLHEKIFTPLEMDDSYLMLYSKPKKPQRPLAEIRLKGTEISQFKSLSIDWAGGGIVSTAPNLAVFIRALNKGKIIKLSTLNQFYNFDNTFIKGIHYGAGFMEFHFEEFFPGLGSLPRLRGHMGVLGTQMLYDEKTDTVYISSFGSTDFSAGSVKIMIEILSLAKRIKQ